AGEVLRPGGVLAAAVDGAGGSRLHARLRPPAQDGGRRGADRPGQRQPGAQQLPVVDVAPDDPAPALRPVAVADLRLQPRLNPPFFLPSPPLRGRGGKTRSAALEPAAAPCL